MECASGFGSRIKDLRKKSGITTRALSNKVGFSSPSAYFYYEKKDRIDNEAMVKAFAKALNTTEEYLLTGKDPAPKSVLVPNIPAPAAPKPHLNSEGYTDSTAFKAMENVWLSKPLPEVKDVVDNKNGDLFLVFKKLEADTAILLQVYRDPITNHLNFATLKDANGTPYYIDLLKMSTRSRLTKEYRKKFSVSDVSFAVVEAKVRKILGYDTTVIVKTEEPKPAPIPKDDSTSKNFKDSVDYYNEKNHTSFEYPQGPISLETAVNLSKEIGITLDDLCKDHTEERITLMEISELEEKLKKLKSKIGVL